MDKQKRNKIIRALNQSFKIAIQHSVRKLSQSKDKKVFDEALRRFYLNEGLPKDYDNTLELRSLSSYYRAIQPMQTVKQELTLKQEDEVCDLLLEVGLWLHLRWGPKIKTLMIKVCGGKREAEKFAMDLYDIRDRTPNGIHLARMLNLILDA